MAASLESVSELEISSAYCLQFNNKHHEKEEILATLGYLVDSLIGSSSTLSSSVSLFIGMTFGILQKY